ncbi:hypothetical protein HZC30_06790 [Candidatus Woesearchaeota archaeon]|nr:hypothetical protein [Candidatus Woesearchaeota archaeon]
MVGETRDPELDVLKASEVARNWMKENIGSLNLHEFKIENISQNGTNTRHIVICSVIPDVGSEKEYYLIKVDITTNKIVLPLGKGKLKDSELILEELKIDPKWTQ